ncbi:MAG TPA: threonine--tRNA ligase, partial [Chloroflexota bacterium]|nr:threonine--tRNA ligase [Chloroflexota bacterium]
MAQAVQAAAEKQPAEEDRLKTMRHSAAHVMAEAVLQLFPDAKLGIGPAIQDGFYYDFQLPRSLVPEDLEEIEKRMRELVKQNAAFERRELTAQEAVALFEQRSQPFKVELIRDLTSGRAEGVRDEAAESPDAEGVQGDRVSLYKQGAFEDLCG